jgi:outer membrane protein insertion porin family
MVILVAMLAASCSGLKHVPDNEKLFTGSEIKFVQDKKIRTSRVESEAKEILRPEPNAKFLGNRFGLWWYYHTQNQDKKIRKWLRKQLAEDPVYLSQTNPALVAKALDAMLYNHGFFDSYTAYDINEHKKTASIVYTIVVKPPYTIGSITYPTDSSKLSRAIAESMDKTLLKPKRRYNLDRLVKERQRIDEYLKKRGFYFFNDANLEFAADTSLGNRTVNIRLKTKDDMAQESKQVFTVSDVNVYTEYHLGAKPLAPVRVIDSVNFYSANDYIRPQVVIRSVFLRNDKIYNREDHSLTLNRLMGLGVYKFVNVRFAKTDSSDTRNRLTANVFLIPLPKKSLTVEVQGVSKSNNFLGPGVNGSFRNRNALRGAELLVVNMRSSFETQLNGPYKGFFTYELNPKVELYVPRFISPVRIRANSMFVPKTKFAAEFSYISRVNYFDINSYKLSYGYQWKDNIATDHVLTPFNLMYFNIYNQSGDFLSLVETNPVLGRRYEKQFIAGLAYSYFYNQQVYAEKRRPFYINVNAESAGSTISAFNRLTGKTPDPENPLKVAGVNYSQFLKADVDLRQYFILGNRRQSSVALRFMAGWGKPFGNSSFIPYVKQFFSGGAYSVRGFPAFSLGPGTYAPPDSLKNLFFLQQGGEIKLETNIEYRYTIVGLIKGALFVDAGNTWLNNNNPDIPGGKFNTGTFMKEVAMSVGTGIRVDIQFFVLRLDMGIPVRKPWLPEGDRWVISDIDFSSALWRRNNLIVNLAFGYPF